jgi:hypothetical protein
VSNRKKNKPFVAMLNLDVKNLDRARRGQENEQFNIKPPGSAVKGKYTKGLLDATAWGGADRRIKERVRANGKVKLGGLEAELENISETGACFRVTGAVGEDFTVGCTIGPLDIQVSSRDWWDAPFKRYFGKGRICYEKRISHTDRKVGVQFQ